MEIYTRDEVIELIKKAIIHEDNGEIGSLLTAQNSIREANFNHWIEQNL